MIENASAVIPAKARVVQIEIRQAAVARRILGMFQNVSDAANGVDERWDGVRVHLAAQAINVDINYVRCRVYPHSPNVIQNHRTSDNSPGIPAKIFQERKLLRG